MRRCLGPAIVVLAVLLAGCGSATKTVTISNAPLPASSTSTTATSSTSTSTTSSAQVTTTTSTVAPSTTRTASAPAFVQRESSSSVLNSALAVVREHGYTAASPSEYHSSQTLAVLVGTRTGSSDGYGQQAFFFLDGKYIGTDAKEPSATVKVLSQSDTAVTLAYPLYRKSDPLSSPSGGQATVRFELNNGKLTPVGTIPPASSSGGELSRN